MCGGAEKGINAQWLWYKSCDVASGGMPNQVLSDSTKHRAMWPNSVRGNEVKGVDIDCRVSSGNVWFISSDFLSPQRECCLVISHTTFRYLTYCSFFVLNEDVLLLVLILTQSWISLIHLNFRIQWKTGPRQTYIESLFTLWNNIL